VEFERDANRPILIAPGHEAGNGACLCAARRQAATGAKKSKPSGSLLFSLRPHLRAAYGRLSRCARLTTGLPVHRCLAAGLCIW
jgi:hypothetical protein